MLQPHVCALAPESALPLLVDCQISGRWKTVWRLSILAIATMTISGCKNSMESAEKRIEPVYDRATGRLQLIKYDSDGDGKTDVWTYMDGSRVIRTETDTDHDGKVDRWQY